MSESDATWATRLWFDNDPGLYADLQSALADERSAYDLAAWIKEYVEMMAEDDVPPDNLIGELFNIALRSVDWQALAEHYIKSWEAENK